MGFSNSSAPPRVTLTPQRAADFTRWLRRFAITLSPQVTSDYCYSTGNKIKVNTSVWDQI